MIVLGAIQVVKRARSIPVARAVMFATPDGDSSTEEERKESEKSEVSGLLYDESYHCLMVTLESLIAL